jgi:hypothetical protein
MLSTMEIHDQGESLIYNINARTILRLNRDDIQDDDRHMSDGECVREQVADSG